MNRLLAARVLSSAVALALVAAAGPGANAAAADEAGAEGEGGVERATERTATATADSGPASDAPTARERRRSSTLRRSSTVAPAASKHASPAPRARRAPAVRAGSETAGASVKPRHTRADRPDSESARGLRQDLAEIEGQMREENERHQAAVARMRAAEQEAVASGKDRAVRKARKALEKAESTYQSRKSMLNDQRRDLLRRLNAGGTTPARTASR